MTNTITPRIYVACLASYNNGILHGEWLNADDGLDTLQAGVREMLQRSPMPGAEEFAIHDCEGFGSAGLSEYEGLDSVAKKAEFISEHGELGLVALDHCCGDLSDAEQMIDRYAGEYESLADFAEELTSQTITVPENLSFYIDYAAMGRDMELNGDVVAVQQGFDQYAIFWGS